jgi:hypothetical protein
MTKPGKPINANGQNDQEVLFGEISEHTVTSLNNIINSIFNGDNVKPSRRKSSPLSSTSSLMS